MCQRRHYRSHKKIFDAILHLFNQQKKEVVKRGQCQANSSLIGKQNVVKLYINDKPVDIIWDTGTKISIIS